MDVAALGDGKILIGVGTSEAGNGFHVAERDGGDDFAPVGRGGLIGLDEVALDVGCVADEVGKSLVVDSLIGTEEAGIGSGSMDSWMGFSSEGMGSGMGSGERRRIRQLPGPRFPRSSRLRNLTDHGSVEAFLAGAMRPVTQ